MNHNKYAGRFLDSQIQEMICREGYTHNGIHKHHFEAGESKCRRCNIFYKLLWIESWCPNCGDKLAHSSRHRDRSKRYVNAY